MSIAENANLFLAESFNFIGLNIPNREKKREKERERERKREREKLSVNNTSYINDFF